ncbi:hypothetical protein BN979_03770 [Mycolicibacterium vulneris]|nr:hypothetical protein BST41_29800 [Mycolicibacterium porcinum]CDO30960.1 hypothetical protein BN979_03770 [Mycolicibacterium vulneris]
MVSACAWYTYPGGYGRGHFVINPHNRNQIGRGRWEATHASTAACGSMRKLAEPLGVATMTIYGYVRNKQE